MVQRHGPPLRSLIFDKAIKADHVIRQEVADSHQGQKPNRFNQRPDRFMQPEPTVPIRIILRREASIDYGMDASRLPGTIGVQPKGGRR